MNLARLGRLAAVSSTVLVAACGGSPECVGGAIMDRNAPACVPVPAFPALYTEYSFNLYCPVGAGGADRECTVTLDSSDRSVFSVALVEAVPEGTTKSAIARIIGKKPGESAYILEQEDLGGPFVQSVLLTVCP